MTAARMPLNRYVVGARREQAWSHPGSTSIRVIDARHQQDEGLDHERHLLAPLGVEHGQDAREDARARPG